MLNGKIIILADKTFGFDYRDSGSSKPIAIRQVWPLASLRTHGMSYCTVLDAIGKPASCQYGAVSCYLGNGNYVSGELTNGGSTRAIITEEIPIPCPKVRAGIETRWNEYKKQWEKCLKSGWARA